MQGSIKAGYGPDSAFNMLGNVTSAINEMAATAMQGYQPAKPGQVQGPHGFQPDAPAPAPGRQGSFGDFQQFAGLSQSTGPAPENYGRGTPALQHLSPIIDPQAPTPPDWGKPQPAAPPLYTPDDPGMFNPFRGNEAALPPDEQNTLLDFLQNFNPISTAEARGGRSQAGQPDGTAGRSRHNTGQAFGGAL